MFSWLTVAAALGAPNPWPELGQLPPAEGPAANDAAIIIAIEDYVFLADIPGAEANARDWYYWFITGRGLPPGKVKLIRNADAVRETVLDELAVAARSVGSGGTLWVVYVGHGAPSMDGNDGLLVGADAQQTPRSLYSRSVSQTELLAAVEGVHTGTTLMVLDACFSGRDESGPLVEGLQPVIPTWARSLPPAVIQLSAAANDEFAGPLPGGSRPAFSYLVLGALRGWGDRDGDGKVTATEAVEYTQMALTMTLSGRSQRPQIDGKGDVTLSQGLEKGPDLLAITSGATQRPAARPPEPRTSSQADTPTLPEPVVRAVSLAGGASLTGGTPESWQATQRARIEAIADLNALLAPSSSRYAEMLVELAELHLQEGTYLLLVEQDGKPDLEKAGEFAWMIIHLKVTQRTDADEAKARWVLALAEARRGRIQQGLHAASTLVDDFPRSEQAIKAKSLIDELLR